MLARFRQKAKKSRSVHLALLLCAALYSFQGLFFGYCLKVDSQGTMALELEEEDDVTAPAADVFADSEFRCGGSSFLRVDLCSMEEYPPIHDGKDFHFTRAAHFGTATRMPAASFHPYKDPHAALYPRSYPSDPPRAKSLASVRLLI